MKPLLKPSILLLSLSASAISLSQDTRFAQTYTWLTEAKGEHEIEVKMTRVDRDNWVSENEFETGITDRLTIAPYVNLEFGKNSHALGGWALEARYRFGDLKARTLLPALYLEPQQVASDPAATLESRLIGTYYPTDRFDTLLSGNLVMTRLMARDEAVNYGYSVGGVKMKPKDWFGIEAYGSWTDRSHFMGPTAGLKMQGSSVIIFHFGFSLNKEDNQLKVIYARDF